MWRRTRESGEDPWIEGQRGRRSGPQGRPVPPLLTRQSPGLAFHPSEKEEEPAAASYDRPLPAIN